MHVDDNGMINDTIRYINSGGNTQIKGTNTRETVWQAEAGHADYPVTHVTWYGAKAFAEWLGGDLPSEAEWEVACRSARVEYDGLFSFSSTENGSNGYEGYEKYVNCRDEIPTNGKNETLPVNQLLPNNIGLHNMHGNVAEWCRDVAARNAVGSPAPYDYSNSSRYDTYHILRGGSWKDLVTNCRSASRTCLLPETSGDDIGFRVVFPVSNVPNLDFAKIEEFLSVPSLK
jgi:formylglycine-generating enzyme required for sulfatase activity